MSLSEPASNGDLKWPVLKNCSDLSELSLDFGYSSRYLPIDFLYASANEISVKFLGNLANFSSFFIL